MFEFAMIVTSTESPNVRCRLFKTFEDAVAYMEWDWSDELDTCMDEGYPPTEYECGVDYAYIRSWDTGCVMEWRVTEVEK